MADVSKLGLDLDGLLDEATEFFALLSRIWPSPKSSEGLLRDDGGFGEM